MVARVLVMRILPRREWHGLNESYIMQEASEKRRQPQLVYGLSKAGHLLGINDVANGLACQCVCPSCGAPLVARNNGVNTMPHFAHASGTACDGAHESELHLLAKEIIASEKAIMLPPYGTIYKGSLQTFDDIEVEQRSDCSNLQPDLVGVVKSATSDSQRRLWIEIKVTHEVDAAKRDKIRQLGMACIEIDLAPFIYKESSRDELRAFLIGHRDYRSWVHNPLLESVQRKNEEQKRAYREQMAIQSTTIHYSQADVRKTVKDFRQQNDEEGRVVKYKRCSTCPYHTSRKIILDEIKLQKFPALYRDFFKSTNIHLWKENTLMHPLDKEDFNIVYSSEQQFYFPLKSPDRDGNRLTERQIDQNRRLVKFFGITLPDILRLHGIKCKHNQRVLPSNRKDLRIVCNYKKTEQ